MLAASTMLTIGGGSRLSGALLLAWASVALVQAQSPQSKETLLRLSQPFPDADQMRQRKASAEALPLFAGEEPIAFTFTGDFRAVNRDHDPNSRRQYPMQLTMSRPSGEVDTLPVMLNARGHVRRMARTCDYVPLRIQFPKDQIANTIFAGQERLKLVVQCRNGGVFEQYLLKEYLAYRIYNTLTTHGLRARLAKVSYVDQAGKPVGTRFGMLLEDDSDMAKRVEGRVLELQRTLFKDLDADTLSTMMVFSYMIGSTDFSIYVLHNVIMVQKPDRKLYPVPYDFDMAGLVSSPYAIPDKQLPITNVKDRYYRGPCHTSEQLRPVLAKFNTQKDRVLALPDAIADLSRSSRDEVKRYLQEFYSSISDPATVRRPFVEGCSKSPGM